MLKRYCIWSKKMKTEIDHYSSKAGKRNQPKSLFVNSYRLLACSCISTAGACTSSEMRQGDM